MPWRLLELDVSQVRRRHDDISVYQPTQLGCHVHLNNRRSLSLSVCLSVLVVCRERRQYGTLLKCKPIRVNEKPNGVLLHLCRPADSVMMRLCAGRYQPIVAVHTK